MGWHASQYLSAPICSLKGFLAYVDKSSPLQVLNFIHLSTIVKCSQNKINRVKWHQQDYTLACILSDKSSHTGCANIKHCNTLLDKCQTQDLPHHCRISNSGYLHTKRQNSPKKMYQWWYFALLTIYKMQSFTVRQCWLTPKMCSSLKSSYKKFILSVELWILNTTAKLNLSLKNKTKIWWHLRDADV